MFTYIMVGSNDLQKSKAFYDATFGALGYGAGIFDEHGTECAYLSENGAFVFVKPIDGKPACHANGGTIGLTAPDAATVDAWHAAGVANGGASCEDPPGIRDDGKMQAYCAYLRDPDGNKLCALSLVK